MPESFPTLPKTPQEAQQISVRMNPKKFTKTHQSQASENRGQFLKCRQQQEKHDILPVGEQFALKQASFQ